MSHAHQKAHTFENHVAFRQILAALRWFVAGLDQFLQNVEREILQALAEGETVNFGPSIGLPQEACSKGLPLPQDHEVGAGTTRHFFTRHERGLRSRPELWTSRMIWRMDSP